MKNFESFGLSGPILKAVTAKGYDTPTPIQAQAIPLVLAKRDVIGAAQTGTGKTAAFTLPILDRLNRDQRHREPMRVRVLILSPTRELASQIEESVRTYGKFAAITSTTVFGGASMGKQKQTLARGIDILVATPGRLIDLLQQGCVKLDKVEILVLDEADQMLDLGFLPAIEKIVRVLPKDRQSLMFSATMPPPIRALAERFLRDPVSVAVAPVATTADRVEQHVAFVSREAKPGALVKLLRDPDVTRAIVFTRTKHGADKVVRKLESSGIAAAAIHGNKSQPQREKVLAQFRDGSCRVLIATDIAARGIDIPDVSHVFNYELPNVPESYVHRIGRTARAGRAGIAISLCDGEERAYLRSIERLTRLSVPVLRIDGVAAPTAKELMEEVASPSTQRQQRPPRRDGTDPRRSSRPQGNGNRANSDRRAAPAAKPAASKPAGSKPAHAGAKPRGMSWSRAEIAGLQGRQRPRPN